MYSSTVINICVMKILQKERIKIVISIAIILVIIVIMRAIVC